MRDFSFEEICKNLKAKFKKDCKNLHRSTIQTWARSSRWDLDKADLAKKAIKKAKATQIKELDDFKETLEDYHAESYLMDADLRKHTFKKLLAYLESMNIDALNAKFFLDVFRVSTNNIARLYAIANGDKDDEPLLDDLLKMRGQKLIYENTVNESNEISTKAIPISGKEIKS